jgi:hypothetical protein
MSTAAPGTAVTLHTPQATAINPIGGSLPERLIAFKEIASAIAQSQIAPNGWDSASKVMTACWAADAMGVHPYTYMENVYVADMGGGKKLQQPKWEFQHALLKSRLPGYRFRVMESTNERAVLWATDGIDEHTVTYTMADAVTQRLAQKDTYKANPKQMLFKQAFHLLAKLVGAHILHSLPAPDAADYEVPARLHEASAVEVLDAAVSAPAPTPALPPAAPPVKPHARLGKNLERVFALKEKDHAGKLRRASLVMTQIRGAEVVFTKAENISPSDADEISAFLEKKYPLGTTEAAAPAAPANGGGATEGSEGKDAPAARTGVACEFPECPNDATTLVGDQAWCDDHTPPPHAEDETPPPAAEAPTAIEQQGEDFMREQDGKLATLIQICALAEKQMPGHSFLKESPKGSKKWWFIYLPILAEMGRTGDRASIKVSDAGEQSVDADTCRRLVVAVRSLGVAPGETMGRMANRSGGGHA